MEILGATLDDLTVCFKKKYDKGRFHAGALFREVFKNGNLDFLNAPEFMASPSFRQRLQGGVTVTAGRVVDTFREDQLTKFITALSDGLHIESVIIPMTNHKTLCVSSQVGCRMGCRFCRTARMGFSRNLAPHEITGQLFNARFVLRENIKNVVLMGMGEPLDNLDAVVQALKIMNEQKGFNVAFRRMTLSTAGLADKIGHLARQDLKGLRIAVSINSATDAVRNGLMPVNRRWGLARLKQALLSFPLPSRGEFLFEYILIKGLNDTAADAQALARFISGLPVRLNLIPFNEIEGVEFRSPDDQAMHTFAGMLEELGIFVIKRWSRGRSLGAGCGQLGPRNPENGQTACVAACADNGLRF